MLTLRVYLSFMDDRKAIERELESLSNSLVALYASSTFKDARMSVRIEVPCEFRERIAYLAGLYQYDDVRVESYEWQECRTIQTVKMVLVREWIEIPF